MLGSRAHLTAVSRGFLSFTRLRYSTFVKCIDSIHACCKACNNITRDISIIVLFNFEILERIGNICYNFCQITVFIFCPIRFDDNNGFKYEFRSRLEYDKRFFLLFTWIGISHSTSNLLNSIFFKQSHCIK